MTIWNIFLKGKAITYRHIIFERENLVLSTRKIIKKFKNNIPLKKIINRKLKNRAVEVWTEIFQFLNECC